MAERADRHHVRRRRIVGVVVLVSFGVAAAVGAYALARTSSVFALERIEVEGAPPAVARQIRDALEPYRGRSLVAFDPAAATRRLSVLSEIAGTKFDRSFPHTLRVRVHLERPVAVLRQGSDAWLVSSSARVLQKLDHRPYPPLPRIWIPRSATVAANSTLAGPGAAGVAAVAPLGPLRVNAHVRWVRSGDGELTLVLTGGRELRLGDTADLRLKLAIARRILPLTLDAAYVDVSVPERPVSGYNPRVEG